MICTLNGDKNRGKASITIPFDSKVCYRHCHTVCMDLGCMYKKVLLVQPQQEQDIMYLLGILK